MSPIKLPSLVPIEHWRGWGPCMWESLCAEVSQILAIEVLLWELRPQDLMLQNLWEVTGWWGSLDRALPFPGLFTLTYGSSLPKLFSLAAGWDPLQMDVNFQYDDLSLVSGWECKLRETWQCYQVTQAPVGTQAPRIHSKSNTTQCFKFSRLIFLSPGRKCGRTVRRSP